MKIPVAFIGILACTVIVILVFTACRPGLCITGGPHQWSRWEPETKANSLGYYRQMHHCTNCNLLQIEYIK